jgi:hypothetical protein
MASSGKKKILIIASVLIIAGVGGYFIYRKIRSKKEEEERKKAEEQALLDSQSNKPGGGYSAPSSNSSSISNPFPDSASLKKFQQWVIDFAKDSAILGNAGADGVWGNSSAKAWSKYGTQYKAVQGLSASATSQNTSNVIGKNAVANKTTYVYSTPSAQKDFMGFIYNYAIGTVSSGNKLGKIKGIRENEGKVWYEVEISIGLSNKNAPNMYPSNYIPNPKVAWVNSANINVQ